MIVTCIGCGADDLHPSAPETHWLRVDRAKGLGVCSACPDFAITWDAAHAFGPPHFDLVAHLRRQRIFYERIAGPGPRIPGYLGRVGMEEWAADILLRFEAALRAGFEPDRIALAIATAQTRREGEAVSHVFAPAS